MKEKWKDPAFRAKCEIWRPYQDDILVELFVKYCNPSTKDMLWDLAMKDPLYYTCRFRIFTKRLLLTVTWHGAVEPLIDSKV